MNESLKENSNYRGVVNFDLSRKPKRDLSGLSIGRTTVTKYLGRTYGGHDVWECICSCKSKTLFQALGLNLRRGRTGSCGCIVKERAAEANRIRLTSHGKRFTRTYRCWANMKTRATNHKADTKNQYINRGITICERWLTFENFLEDMGDCPSQNHSIDRWPDKNGNYEPNNCRWATTLQQGRNTRGNRLIAFRGRVMCIAEWAEEVGLDYCVLQARITQMKWSIERALTTPNLKQTPRGPTAPKTP